MNQRPSGLSHKALPCLPLENIVALLAWSASQFSLFSHLSTTPVSATGGGVPLRPNERSSSRHNPERKKRAGLLTYSFMVAEAGLEPTTFGFVSQGLALLAPRKHSRPARLERFTVLLVFSPQLHPCIRHRRRAASPQRA